MSLAKHPMQHPDQRVGVFIDVQNMYYSGRNLYDAKVNFAKIVERAVADRKLVRAIAYVVRTKTREEQPFIDALQKVGIETKEKEILEYAGGAKKADWDVGIAVDAIRMSEILDCVVIVSGDGDFVPLLDYLKGHGRQAEVISFRETTSTMLVQAADVYTNMSDALDEFLIKDGRTHRRPLRTESATGDTAHEEQTPPTPPVVGGSQKWTL